ncbi:hypothetical protein O6P43_033004 [Quillaja saponaria]|uniref:Uncharacterized protein n=1 Tax=Quillaja saponaria TaxID=32244 RepID=A0AAD7KPV8_QUISA|nr:hypothetical protein O6P43_033004 [Quillaja saponaria]
MYDETSFPSTPHLEHEFENYLPDETIVKGGVEPSYRPGKGKQLGQLVLCTCELSSSEDTEIDSEDTSEDEVTALACFSPEREEDLEDDVDTFYPQTNTNLISRIESTLSNARLATLRKLYFEPVGAKVSKASAYDDRLHHSRPITFCFYEEYICAKVHYPFHPFVVKVLNALGICPT